MMHAAHETERTVRSRRFGRGTRVIQEGPTRDLPDSQLPDELPPFEVVPIEEHDLSEPTYRSSAKPLVYGIAAYIGVLFLLLGVAYSLSLFWT